MCLFLHICNFTWTHVVHVFVFFFLHTCLQVVITMTNVILCCDLQRTLHHDEWFSKGAIASENKNRHVGSYDETWSGVLDSLTVLDVDDLVLGTSLKRKSSWKKLSAGRNFETNESTFAGRRLICKPDLTSRRTVKVSPISWRSPKLQRKVSSTLAGETLALSRVVAEVEWLRRWCWRTSWLETWRCATSPARFPLSQHWRRHAKPQSSTRNLCTRCWARAHRALDKTRGAQSRGRSWPTL